MKSIKTLFILLAIAMVAPMQAQDDMDVDFIVSEIGVIPALKIS